MRRSLYLAGPDVFLPDAVAVGRRKKRLCDRHGFIGLFPLDNEARDDGSGTRLDAIIYRGNVEMMRRCDGAVLNLTPFRGVSADPGTVFELGLLIGLGKPVFAYTNDPEPLLARVKRAAGARADGDPARWRDGEGLTIEDFGNADNLMIDRALAEAGQEIVRPATAPADTLRDLSGFEECLRRATRFFAPGEPAEETSRRRRMAGKQ